MPASAPIEDPVADLYDGFVRRQAEPGVGDDIARDIAWRRDTLRPERRAGARIARVVPFVVSFLLPASRRESIRMALFWAAFFSIVLLVSFISKRTGPLDVACGAAVVAIPGVVALVVFLSGLDLLFTRGRPGACQACGYHVESLPPALDPDLTFGEAIGPARCPECGLRWPLVPRGGIK